MYLVLVKKQSQSILVNHRVNPAGNGYSQSVLHNFFEDDFNSPPLNDHKRAGSKDNNNNTLDTLMMIQETSASNNEASWFNTSGETAAKPFRSEYRKEGAKGIVDQMLEDSSHFVVRTRKYEYIGDTDPIFNTT